MKSLIYEIVATAGTIEMAATRLLKPFGLTPMTFNILNVLEDGPLSQREISERVIVAASSITFQVRQLRKKGLLQRKRLNARTWQVSLTALGAEKRTLAQERMDGIIDQLHIDPRLGAQARSALESVRQKLPLLTPANDPK